MREKKTKAVAPFYRCQIRNRVFSKQMLIVCFDSCLLLINYAFKKSFELTIQGLNFSIRLVLISMSTIFYTLFTIFTFLTLFSKKVSTLNFMYTHFFFCPAIQSFDPVTSNVPNTI